jgi:hypothetical protein
MNLNKNYSLYNVLLDGMISMMILKWLGNEYAVEILKWFGNEFLFKNSCSHFMLSASLSFVLLMENSVKGICSIVHNILLMVETGENKK